MIREESYTLFFTLLHECCEGHASQTQLNKRVNSAGLDNIVWLWIEHSLPIHFPCSKCTEIFFSSFVASN